MKNYEFVISAEASEVIDELAKQLGVSAAGVIRHGLELAANQFRRHDLMQKLAPLDCVGLSGVTNLQENPVGPDDLPDPQRDTDPPEMQNQQQTQTPPVDPGKTQDVETGDTAPQTQSTDQQTGDQQPPL